MRQSNLKLWRVVTRQRADGAFSGEGSVMYGGRWHSKGTRLVYTADSLSSAILETTVHMNATTMYLEYVYFCVTVSDDIEIDEIDRNSLNSDWSNISAPVYLFVLDRQMQAIKCKVFEPYDVKTVHLISKKRLKNLAPKGFPRSSASPT